MTKHKLSKAHSKKTLPTILKFIALLMIISLIIVGGVVLLPHAQSLFSKESRDILIATIQELGIVGMLIFTLIQITQVVIFIIPGEAIEVIAGMLYGPWWGYLVCQIGVILGTVAIFCMVKGLGYDFIKPFIDESKFENFKFLQNNKKVEHLIFLLFFIPGTPKDLLTYFIPFTDISLGKFLILSTIARIPAILSSTLAGASLQQGNLGESIMIFTLIGLISIAGIWYNRILLTRENKKQVIR